MNDVRAMSICYKLLSRMEPRAQEASLGWLNARLAADKVAVQQHARDVTTGRHKAEFRRLVGQVALDLLALVKITGGKSGKRSAEIRGPLNVDVEICVRPVLF